MEKWKRTEKLWKTVVRSRGRGRDADAPAGGPRGPNPDPSPTDEDYYDEDDDNDYNNDYNTEDNELRSFSGYLKWRSTRAKMKISVRAIIVTETDSPTSRTCSIGPGNS